MKDQFEKLCNTLNIDKEAIDTYTYEEIQAGFYAMFLKHNSEILINTINFYRDNIMVLFVMDGGNRNLRRSFRYALNGVRFYYTKHNL